MLFIDQPVQVGFSYDTLVNGTFDLLSQVFTPTNDFSGTNATNIAGTLPSQDLSSTASTSAASARTLWHFSQVWFSEFVSPHIKIYLASNIPRFPKFKIQKRKISLWANSVWQPAFVSFFIILTRSSTADTMHQLL
jgi:hypothetical protein